MREVVSKQIILSLEKTFSNLGLGSISFHPYFWGDLYLISQYHAKIDFSDSSGDYSGFLCLSLSEDFSLELLKDFKVPVSKKYIFDIVSELTNIIAGNLGVLFKNGFSISVPSRVINNLLEGNELLHIPLEYKGNAGMLIIDLNKFKSVEFVH